MKKACIIGAAGRMGQNVARALWECRSLDIGGAIEREDHPFIGRDVGDLIGVGKLGITIKTDPKEVFSSCSVVIDFSAPGVITKFIDEIVKNKIAIVSGTTGQSAEDLKKLKEASKYVPVLVSPNMSLGVNLLFYLVEIAAKALKEYDTEIVEIHHKHKKDAPSGTALRLAEIIKSVKNGEFIFGREGKDSLRKPEEIGVFALRGGDVVGDHDVYFLGNGERIVLSHKAHTRMTFARGAVVAAAELLKKEPGFYSMRDILNLF